MLTTRFWVAVGTSESWHTAFLVGGIWGLVPAHRKSWESLQENSDLIFFYVKKPIMGVVGYGIVRTKFVQQSPLFPEELARNEVIWPLRFEFDPLSAIEPAQWQAQKTMDDRVRSRLQSGFFAIDRATAEELIKQLPNSASGYPARNNPFVTVPKHVPLGPMPPFPQDDPHTRTKLFLSEIGQMQRYVTDTEYPLENRRLDVVWRRVQRSVPSFVFEVQVGGNLTEALAKLKHAHELWNSNIFLVGKEEHRGPTQQLVGGTFHEIQPRLRFIELSQIEDLYQRKRAYREFESELGIIV